MMTFSPAQYLSIGGMGQGNITDQLQNHLMNYLKGKEQSTRLQYLPEALKAELTNQQLQNQKLQTLMPFLAPQMQAELANQQQVNKYYGPNIQSQISERNANIPLIKAQADMMNFKKENPLYGATGPAGQVGSLMMLEDMEKNGTLPKGHAELLKQNIFSNLQKNQAETQYKQKVTEGMDYDRAPVDYKNAMMAQAVAFGYEPSEASKLLRQGKTLTELAEKKGLGNSPDVWPLADFAPTAATRTSVQKREQAQNEVEAIGNTINAWAAPYSQGILGGTKLIKDQLNNSNKDQRVKFLAAQMLLPELASQKMRALQGQVGITSIQELMHRSALDQKYIRSLFTPDEIKEAADLSNAMINRASNLATKIAYSSGMGKKDIDVQQTSRQDLSHLSDEELRKIAGGQK